MQITELKNEGLDFEVKVIIPADKIINEIQKELTNLTKKVKVDGFRFGKVPLSIINKKYGASVKSDVVQHQVRHSIEQVIKDNNLNIATDPKIEGFKSEDGKDLEFTLKFELMPKISIPDLKKISLEKPFLKVSDADIDSHIEKLIEFSKEYTKESKAKPARGDQVTIDAIGYVDNKAFEGGKLDNYKLVLGSKTFIDTFEDQLIGSKAGDELTVKVTFPDDYQQKDLAGKPAEFKVVVKAVHKAEMPKIDDEFAKKFNCETVEKLRDQISKNIASIFAEPIHTLMKMRLFDQLENILKFDVPESLTDREYQILKSQVEQEEGGSLPIKGKKEKDLNEYYKSLSLRRVRIGLMLAEYVKEKALRIEQNDLRDAVMAQARNFPGQEKSVVEFYQKNTNALESLKGTILEEKAVKHIFDNEIKIIEKEYNKKALEKFLEAQSQE